MVRSPLDRETRSLQDAEVVHVRPAAVHHIRTTLPRTHASTSGAKRMDVRSLGSSSMRVAVPARQSAGRSPSSPPPRWRPGRWPGADGRLPGAPDDPGRATNAGPEALCIGRSRALALLSRLPPPAASSEAARTAPDRQVSSSRTVTEPACQRKAALRRHFRLRVDNGPFNRRVRLALHRALFNCRWAGRDCRLATPSP